MKARRAGRVKRKLQAAQMCNQKEIIGQKKAPREAALELTASMGAKP